MNIGKIICLLLIIPLCCGCNEHETSSAPSFRQCFIEVYYSGGLELPMLQTGYFGTQPTVPPQNLQTGFVITPNYSHNNMCDSFSDPEEFLRLATRNDDTSFNQWVPDHLCLRTPAFANNFRELHVVSNADWDEEHPAGSLLDDILLVRLYSYANFIHEGYPGKNDNTFLSKRKYLSVIKKLMSELTPADMEMIYCCEVNDFSTDTLYPVIVFTSAPDKRLIHCNFGWGGTANGYYYYGAFDLRNGPEAGYDGEDTSSSSDKYYDMELIVTYTNCP